MKNLSGVLDCDDYIREELRKARIEMVHCERTQSEVPYRLTGKLNGFTFERAWYYWVATGLMPIGLAQELYADPIGKTDARVAGHCGCPAPEDPWIEYIDVNGLKLIPMDQYDEFVRIFKGELYAVLNRTNSRFSNDLKKDGLPYITSYHIDSMEGLRLFADTIRKIGY